MARTSTRASKSDRLRAELRSGTALAVAARKLDMNYAFAYGVAKRLAEADSKFDLRTVTGERKVKGVAITGNVVKIRLIAAGAGFVSIDRETGKITRSKR